LSLSSEFIWSSSI